MRTISTSVLLLGCLALAPSAAARPAASVPLPTSGLAVNLPSSAFHVTGNFAFDGSGFWARDVIDENAADGSLLSTTYVAVSTFGGTSCRDGIAAEQLAQPMQLQSARRWGTTWTVGGGFREFSDLGLGTRRAIALCAQGPDHDQIVITYAFLHDDPAALTAGQAMTRALHSAPAVEAVARAFLANKTATGPSLQAVNVHDLGAMKTSRTIGLHKAGILLTLPDDGFMWMAMANDDEARAVDYLRRVAPALPSVTVAIGRVASASCDAAFAGDAQSTKQVALSHVPTEWNVGPTHKVDGDTEHVLCKRDGKSTLVVGLFAETTDLAPFKPLLDAISHAPELKLTGEAIASQ